MKRAIILLLLLSVLVGGWYWWKHQESERLNSPVVFYGNVDIREVRLGFRVSGRVREVLKEEGDRIGAGEIVARLDDEPYRNAVAQAEAQVESLAARVEELKNGNRPEEIDRARKNLAAAQAKQEHAQIIFNRQKRLIATSAVAQQDFDNARSALQASTALRDAAQAALNLLNAGTRNEQIAQAEANLAAARATLAQARTNLADTVLVAPEAGVALTRVVEPGSIVQAGSVILSESLTNPVRVRAYAPEPQLGLVHPGREVLVFTDSRPEPYHGQIGDVSPRAEFTPKSVETPELRIALVYRFRVIIRDADQGLRQGMPVTIRLATEVQTAPPGEQGGHVLPQGRLKPAATDASELQDNQSHFYHVARSEGKSPGSAPAALSTAEE